MIFKIELKSLPFELTKEQVFYVENEYNEKVNSYIQFNYDEICKAFSDNGMQFCYLPKLKEELAEASDLSAGYISQLEAPNCFFCPSLKTLFVIAEVLGTTVSKLTDIED